MKKKNSQLTTHNSQLNKDELTEFLLYTAPNGDVKVEIILHNENSLAYPKKNGRTL